MKITFVYREPGNHRPIVTVTMAAVPREGEGVEIGDRSFTVHSVGWNIDEKTVYVLVE